MAINFQAGVRWHLYLTYKTKRNTSRQAGVSFWIPGDFKMLGGNEFRLRRGFGLRPKHSYGANAPPRRAGSRSCPASILCGQDKKEAPTLQVLLFWIPGEFQMLGGSTRKGYAASVRRQSRQRLRSEFRLRRGFACGKTLVGCKSAAPLCGGPVSECRMICMKIFRLA